MASSGSGLPGRLPDSNASTDWPGWLAQPVQIQQRQTPNSVLGLGAEIADPGQKGQVQVSMLGSQSPRAGKEKGKDIFKCVHTAPA